MSFHIISMHRGEFRPRDTWHSPDGRRHAAEKPVQTASGRAATGRSQTVGAQLIPAREHQIFVTGSATLSPNRNSAPMIATEMSAAKCPCSMAVTPIMLRGKGESLRTIQPSCLRISDAALKHAHAAKAALAWPFRPWEGRMQPWKGSHHFAPGRVAHRPCHLSSPHTGHQDMHL